MKNPLYTSLQGCTKKPMSRKGNSHNITGGAQRSRSAALRLLAVICLMMTSLGVWGQGTTNYLPNEIYTQKWQVQDKPFAIVRESEEKAVYGTGSASVAYAGYASALTSANAVIQFRIDDLYNNPRLVAVTPSGTDFKIQGNKIAYLSAQNSNGSSISLQTSGTLWDIDYNNENGGWTIKIRNGEYYCAPNSAGTALVTSSTPYYWQFCSLEQSVSGDVLSPGNYNIHLTLSDGNHYLVYDDKDDNGQYHFFASPSDTEKQDWQVGTVTQGTTSYFTFYQDGNGYMSYYNNSFRFVASVAENNGTYFVLIPTGNDKQFYIRPANAGKNDGIVVTGTNYDNPIKVENYKNYNERAKWTFVSSLAYSITIQPSSGGTVTSDVATSAPGSTITLTVTPDADFTLSELTIFDESDNDITSSVNLQIDGNTATFTMPEYNVIVFPQFTKVIDGGFVIYNGTYYLGGSNTNALSAFDPKTCIWNGDGAKLRNVTGNYLKMGSNNFGVSAATLFSQGTDLTFDGEESGTTGKKIYAHVRTGGLFVAQYTDYYLRYDNGWGQTTTASQGGTVLFSLQTVETPEKKVLPVISGYSTVGTLGTTQYTSVGEAYRIAYKDYIFYNRTHHYFDDSGVIIGDGTVEPQEEEFDYAWSLSDNAAGHVTINATTGEVNYTNYYNVDTDVTISLVATSKTTGKVLDKVTKTVTFQYQRVSPTAIATDGNKTLYVGNDYTIDVTLTPTNAYRRLHFSSDNGAVALVDSEGKVTANAVGTATITVQAETMEGTTPEYLKAEVIITVKDIVATPEISFQPDGLSALTTLTTTTTGASIYYTIDGEDPTSASTLYSAPFSVNNLQTVRAIAVMTGANAGYYDNSDVASATYSAQKVPTPTINVRGYEVTFSCYESGVTYYYTTDGSEPTTGSTEWNGNAIDGEQNMTIKVFATKDGLSPSDVASTTLKTAHIVYLDLNNGNDGNNGLTKDKPKRTWGAAYGLLGYGPNAEYLLGQWKANNLTTLSGHANIKNVTDFNNTVDNNIIYLVGNVSADQINDLLGYTNNKSNTTGTSYTTSQSRVLAAGVMKPATISGKYATNGEVQITFPTDSYSTLNEDTRFEHINFRASANGAFLQIMCAYYDLEMGEGVRMSNMLSTANYTDFDTGCAPGTDVPHFQIYGGLENDCRFGQNANSELNFDKYLPHPEGFKIVLRSGFYSTICAGGKKWGVNDINGMMGSPNTPIKCTILVDIDHAYNESVATPLSASRTPNYDIGAILAGNHEGAMFGDVDIVIKSGRIGRVVNGTLGANRTIGNYPMDSFFGRANILVDPRSPLTGEETKYPTKNDMVQIKELYGGSLGRCTDGSTQVKAYFYGKSSVTINGGTFLSALYAGGAGGVNGIGENNRHTNDEKLPYKTGNNINYGTYAQYVAGTKLPVTCHLSRSVNSPDFHEDDNSLDETIDLSDTKAEITIRGGVFGSSSSRIEGIFGGGYGFANEALVNYTDNTIIPHTQAGSLFGKTGSTASKVTIKGGTIWGNVYGAGCGTETYYTSSRNDKGNYTTLGIINGNVELIIDSVAVINGSVYGAGKGVENASLPNMARLYGNTTLTIGENATITGDVYGGGANGSTDGNISVTVKESAAISAGTDTDGNVYGGAKAAVVTGNIVVNIEGGSMNDVFGGNNVSGNVTGQITVNIDDKSSNMVVRNVYGAGNQAAYTPTTPDAYPEVNIKNGTISNNVYGGGLGATAVVTSNPNVNVTGGTAKNIFGGGSQANTIGNPIVNINGGNITEAVYGGGALANTNNTTVNLIGGTVNDVYGGGLGSNDIAAKVGTATVNVGRLADGDTPASGSVITGSVFGCNNLNGTPTGNAAVNVYKTTPQADKDYHVAAVYGGGNKAAYIPADASLTSTNTTKVEVFTCDNSIQYVYGGGNAAPTPATHVIIHGGDFDYVFGGGNGAGAGNPGANVGYYTDVDNNGTPGDAYGTGKANTKILNGVINHLFGGSNTKGNIREAAISTLEDTEDDCNFLIGEVYSAGNEAYMDGTATMNIGCIPGLAVLYGGAKDANIKNDVEMTITSGTYGQVFGGNNLGGTIDGSITVNIEETGCHPIIIGEVYGGGNQAPYTAPVVDGVSVGPVVNAYSFTQIGSVYGGGYGADAIVTGNTTVNVNQVVGKHAVDNKLGVIGTIYGGGNAAKVVGDTNVNIGTLKEYTVITGDEKGNPKTIQGANINPVTVTIPKEISGKTEDTVIKCTGNVFGGGNQADVTGKTNVVIGADKQ